MDLISLNDRRATVQDLTRTVEKALLRTHGRVSWRPAFQDSDDVEPAVAITSGGVAIKFQVLNRAGYAPWPSENHKIEQRYSDVAPAVLRTPTRDAFIGWKTTAWLERRASRDLYDLWALSESQAFTAESVALFKKYGPTGRTPSAWMFKAVPPLGNWYTDLAAQTRLTVAPDEALRAVRTAWAGALGEDWGD